MNSAWKYLRVLCVICALWLMAPAHAANIIFNKISTDNGLSHYTALSLYEDEFGAVWIATPMGVNRYNGLGVKTYLSDLNNERSLSCNHVISVTGNASGEVYLLTKQSLEVLDLHSDAIARCMKFGNDFAVNEIYFNKGLYGIINGQTVVRWAEDFMSCTEILQLAVEKELHALFVDSREGVWVASADDVYYCDPSTRKVRRVVSGIGVNSISEDSEGRIFIGTSNDGCRVLDRNHVEIRHLRAGDGLASNRVRAVVEDRTGHYWIGTYNGLTTLNHDLEVVDTYNYTEEKYGLNSSSIYDLILDSRGNIWVATYFGGVNYFNPREPYYRVLESSTTRNRGLSFPVVRCMLEDGRRNIWIATEGGGLTMYDPRREQFRWFMADKTRNSLSGNNIKSLYYDPSRNALWVGTHLYGLNRLDLETMRFTKYDIPSPPDFRLKNVVSGIVPCEDHLIVVSYEGVFKFYPEQARFEKFLDLTYIRMAFTDSRDHLWLSTTSGQLFSYDLKTGELRSFKTKLTRKTASRMCVVYDMVEDCHGYLWLATFGDGLKRFDPSTGKFLTFNTHNSPISSNYLLGIASLDGQRLIATSNLGYMIFDIERHTFRNCTRQDGFPLHYVNENSLFRSSDSLVYIGGNDGLVAFDPLGREGREGREEVRYPIRFNRLWVGGKEVTPGDGSGILSESMLYTSQIELDSKQNTFSIEFFIPSYDKFERVNTLYCLEGAQDEWHRLSADDRVLKFYNLPPGDYDLLIRPENDTGGRDIARIGVRINPPFYRTPLAYGLYVLAVFAFFGGIFWLSMERMRTREFLRAESRRIQAEKEMNQSKLRFIYAVSRELCTPLAIITGELELMLLRQEFVADVRKKVQDIYNSGLQLLDLIYELMEFRKHDMGRLSIHVTECDICEIAIESYLHFKEYAMARNIDFRFEKSSPRILLWCDYKQVHKIFNNLLSNAFKYTDNGGRITLSLEECGGGDVAIRVQDSGCGMDREDLKHIFTNFYQGKQSTDKLGVGLGLALVKDIVDLHHGTIGVESEPGRGSTFTVKFRGGKSHFGEEQLSDHIIRTDCLPMTHFDDNEFNLPVQDDEEEKMTILIVEDNDLMRRLLVSLFSNYYNVISATDGRTAWDCVHQNDIDLVVSDIIMPGMCGTELCRLIKDNFETCHIPVILLSEKTDVQNCVDGYDAKADDYVTKPFSVRLLLSRCNNIVKNRRLLQQKFMNMSQLNSEMLTGNQLDKEFTQKVIDIIEQNIDDPEFGVQAIIKEMLISRTTLFQKLKAITGHTPMEFIQDVRLKKAAVLLRTRPDLSITAVSDAVGFSSSKYFSRIFKKSYHVRPSDYRNNIPAGEGAAPCENPEKTTDGAE